MLMAIVSLTVCGLAPYNIGDFFLRFLLRLVSPSAFENGAEEKEKGKQLCSMEKVTVVS